MVFLLNKTLGIINTTVENGIVFLLKNTNTFTGINTFKGGINVDNINSINGNTTFNSEIIVNSNITANNGSFIGDNLVINIIEKNTSEGITFQDSITFQNDIDMSNNDINNIYSLTSETLYTDNIETIRSANVIFQNSIDMNYHNIHDVDTIFSNTLNINNISLQNSGSPYITVEDDIDMNYNNIHDVDTIFSNTLNINNISLQSGTSYITVKDDIRFNKTITVNGDLVVDGISTTINSQTLTIDDRFITLNANLSVSGLSYTDPAGIIVDTHNTTEHSRGYLLWTLFDPNDPTSTELNRTWDLSGDNLRGNVLKATTLRGNILDSYYSPNISVISDIDMNNHDISNITSLTSTALTSTDLNIDLIKTNTASNISVMNTIDMNNNDISNINTLTASDLNIDVIKTNTASNISIISDIDMNSHDISNITSLTSTALTSTDLNIDVIKTNTASNISVMNTIDMNNNYIINANIAGLNNSQINVDNGLINARTLSLSRSLAYEINKFNFGSRYGISTIGENKLNIWKGKDDTNYTLFLPENNGQTNSHSSQIIGGDSTTHTSSILAIGAFYKQQNSDQSLNNSQCYLIPPSMINSDVSALKGTILFKTIGEQNENIRFLAGYPNPSFHINELKNSLVPTVGQIVDLLNYLGLDTYMNGKQDNLASTYS